MNYRAKRGIKYQVIAAVPLLGLSLASWGQTLVINIDSSADIDMALTDAINQGNANNGPVSIEFGSGTFTFDDVPVGDTRTPPISGDFTFRPANGGTVTLDGNGGNARGFNILNSGSATFDNITIRNFRSNTDGGGIFNNGTLTLQDSTISGNTASGDGGGLYNGGDLTINNSTISDNAGTSGGSAGGGIFNNGGGINITNSTITSNSAQNDGGGLWNGGGLMTIDGGTISNNTAFDDGGGLWNDDGGDLIVRQSTISGNSVIGHGGGLYTGSGSLTLEGGTISANTANQEGGGLWNGAGTMTIDGTVISNNTAQGGGGIFIQTGPGDDRILIRDTQLSGNTVTTDGGGIGLDINNTNGDDLIVLDDLIINDNLAGMNAGGIDIFGNGDNDTVLIRGTRFEDDLAGIFGKDFEIFDTGNRQDPSVFFVDVIFAGRGTGIVAGENQVGEFGVSGATVETDGQDFFDTTGMVLVGDSAIDQFFAAQPVPKESTPSAEKATCNTFGVGVIQSLGNNITPDTSCGLNGPTDMQNTDAMVVRDPNSGKYGLLPGSPAIDAGRSVVSTQFPGLGPLLPCGYKDVNGLGRPQDGNNDGSFECDIGFIEAQGGPDIGPPQSAAYFDTSRNGEGVFVELIGGDLAFVAMFTYQPDGSGTAWFVGIGTVVGNSVVVDQMLEVEGGVFGAGFDPNAIQRTPVGGLSLVFPNCEAGGQPGRIAFQANPLEDYSALLVDATRLTSIIDCAGGTGTPQSGRSGSFFDLDRSGEGIFVQWLTNGAVLVIWYTFDANGNPLWIINDIGRTTVNGTTVTATMIYPTSSTPFGANFNPDDIVLSDWGTVTLDYQPGCSDIDFGFNPTAQGFSSGNYDYTRLTGLTGTSCDL